MNMNHTLYVNDTFVNDNILYLFNKTIYEYDMKNAGYNLSKAYKLLPEKTLEKLGRMRKEHRTIEIGKLQRSDNTFKENLKKAFQEARRLLFDMNELDVNDIISIKKDAIFTLKECKFQKFLEFIDFREKNFYTSYIRLSRQVELYYSENSMDIKGLSEESVNYHKEYMIEFLRMYFHKMETEDAETVIRYMRRFIDRYKNYDLPVGYYRRFARQDAYYDLKDSDDKYYEYWEENKEDLDIQYNYYNVLIKLIKIPL